MVDKHEFADMLAGQHAMMPTHHAVQDKVVELLSTYPVHASFRSAK